MPASDVASPMYASEGVIASEPAEACSTNNATIVLKLRAVLSTGIMHAISMRPRIINRLAPHRSAHLP